MLTLDLDKHQTSGVHQIRHIGQQVDTCQDGHRQSAVPVTHRVRVCISTAGIQGTPGVAIIPLIKLVEGPEDNGSGIQEDRQ